MIENTIKLCQMYFLEILESVGFQGPICQIPADIEIDFTNYYNEWRKPIGARVSFNYTLDSAGKS